VAQPLSIALPPDLRLGGDYTISVDALDPTTGASVAGVTVSNVTIQVELLELVSGALPPVLLLPAPG
jgi:hypothetical protein